MNPLLRISPLKIGKKTYVLFRIESKRGVSLYDVMDPSGLFLARKVPKQEAIVIAQLHWVRTTPKPPRRSKKKTVKKYYGDRNLQEFLEFTSLDASEITKNYNFKEDENDG